jgi:hypothetical protein
VSLIAGGCYMDRKSIDVSHICMCVNHVLEQRQDVLHTRVSTDHILLRGKGDEISKVFKN